MDKNKILKISIISGIALIIAVGIGITIGILGKDDNHIHDWKKVTVEATCDLEGSSYEKCECGEIQNEQKIEALGHNFVAGKCLVCGISEGHEHQIVIDKAIGATCTTVGLTEGSHCETCGMVLREQMKIAKLGHDFKTWKVYTESTEKVNGEKRRECTRCNYYESAKLPLSNHKYEKKEVIEPTCIEYGYTLYSCTDCDDTYRDDFVEMIEHKDHISEVVATCTTDGYTKYECETCGRIKTTDYKLAEGHNYNEWVTTKYATCGREGLEVRHCTYCKTIEERKIEKLKHNYILVSSELNVTNKFYKCSICSDVITINMDEDVNAEAYPHIYVNEDFTFDIYYDGDNKKYIEENLTIINICYIGSEYEDKVEVREKYTIKQIDTYTWNIDPYITKENNGTFVVTLGENLLFSEYHGNTLTYTYDGEEKEIIEYKENIKFLQKLENKYGNYYPYSINTKDSTKYIYLTIQSRDYLEIGDILYIGSATKISDIISSEKEGIIGKIYNIYQNEYGEYIIILETPKLEEVFNNLDIFVEEEVDFEKYTNLEEDINDEVLASFYQSEDFLEFIVAADQTSQEYFGERKLLSTPLNKDVFLDDVKVETPKIAFSGNIIGIEIEGKYSNPIKTKTGKEIGSFDISFNVKAELKFSILATIKLKETNGIPYAINGFDIRLNQMDRFVFNFNLNFNIDYTLAESEQPKFVFINSSSKTVHKIHTIDCFYVERANEENIVAIKASDLNKYVNDQNYETCLKCKPIEGLDASVLVINKKEDKVHCYNCYHVKDINESNKELYYGKINDLKGYSFCSFCKPQNKEEIEYTDKLLNKLDSSNWSKEVSKVKEWARSTDNYRTEKQSISLGEFKMVIAQIATVHIDIDFVLKFEFLATLDYNYEQTNSNIYGIRIKGGHIEPYHSNKKSVYDKNLTIIGKMNFLTGVKLELNISLLNLNKWINLGMAVELDVIAELDGVAHMSQKNEEVKKYAGVYAEGYLEIEVSASYKLFEDIGSISIYSDKVNMFRKGYEKIYYNYANDMDKLEISVLEYTLDLDKILEVYSYNIRNQITKIEKLDINSRLYKVSFSLENGRYCRYKNGKITISNNAPNEFVDKLIVKVKGDTNWKQYVAGSVLVYLDELEIEINYKNQNAHFHTESSWKVIEEATCIKEGKQIIYCLTCEEILKEEQIEKTEHKEVIDEEVKPTCKSYGLSEGSHCYYCNTIIRQQKSLDKLAHIYINGKCNMCGLEEVHKHTESNWQIIKEASCAQEGKKQKVCTECKEVLVTETIKKLDHTEEVLAGFDATCTEPGLTEGKKCTECGEILVEQEEILVKGHSFKEGKCTVCDSNDPNFESGVSQGLKFTLNEDERSYSLSGIGSCTDENIVIPSMYNGKIVTNIASNAFRSCNSIYSVVIPGNIVEIGDNAFFYCENLSNIEILDGVVEIGESAFSNCEKLIKITLPESIMNIGTGAFYKCINLTNIEIPDEVENLGIGTFSYCKNLSYVKLPSKLSSIERNLFYDCENLMSIDIPNLVTKIDQGAFNRCFNLRKVIFDDESQLQSIGYEAFYYCEKLKEIKGLENSQLEYIGSYAFYACSSLEIINLPNTIRTIYSYAFALCHSLQTLSLPNSIEKIESYAFNWCGFNGVVTIPTGLDEISSHAFAYCKNIVSVYIPENIEKIGDYAFVYCTSLENVIFSDGSQLMEIEGHAFSNCTSMRKIIIPEGITKMGSYVFEKCVDLTVCVLSNKAYGDWSLWWNLDVDEVIWGYME